MIQWRHAWIMHHLWCHNNFKPTAMFGFAYGVAKVKSDVTMQFSKCVIISDVISWRQNNKDLLFSLCRKNKIDLMFSYIIVLLQMLKIGFGLLFTYKYQKMLLWRHFWLPKVTHVYHLELYFWAKSGCNKTK